MKSLFAANHPLLQLARSGYRLPNSYTWLADKLYPLFALILAIVIVLLAQFIGGVVAALSILILVLLRGQEMPTLDTTDQVIAAITPHGALENALFLVCLFAPIFLILAGWLRLFEKRPLWTIGLLQHNLTFNYLRGIVVGWLMFSLAVGVSAALGYLAWEHDPTQLDGLAAVTGIAMLWLGWTVQGAAEEALTRGWLLPMISSRYNTVMGILLSSGLFAMLHLFNLNVSLIAILNIFLFGVFACLYVLYEGNLWGMFAIHSVWNWAQGNFYGFEVSGNPPTGVTLFNLMEVGPDEITGGNFGPEGGLAVTAILLLGCAVVLMASQLRSKSVAQN